jgi:hypothetical protein
MTTALVVLSITIIALFIYAYRLKGRINKVHHDNQYDIKMINGRINLMIDKYPNHYSSLSHRERI